jgi:hypothetical protein
MANKVPNVAAEHYTIEAVALLEFLFVLDFGTVRAHFQ